MPILQGQVSIVFNRAHISKMKVIWRTLLDDIKQLLITVLYNC
jgi:hypothetical protein